MRSTLAANTADTLRDNNVIITWNRRCNVVPLRLDVITMLSLRHVSTGKLFEFGCIVREMIFRAMNNVAFHETGNTLTYAIIMDANGLAPNRHQAISTTGITSYGNEVLVAMALQWLNAHET